MTKKTNKSAHSEQHKKPMEPSLLEEEFGTEMGDFNSAKFIDAFAEKKAKACKKNDKPES